MNQPFDVERFKEEMEWLLDPRPDEDDLPPREYPNERLRKHHGLDFSYMESLNWEGSSTHEYTRLCPDSENSIRVLTRNSDMPDRLFNSALRLSYESVLSYNGARERKGQIRYYPAIILTFWSGFETFVRYSSELLISTSQVPQEISSYLREAESYIDKGGNIKSRTRFQPVLDCYAVFLRYAYGHSVDRGAKYWQGLSRAKDLRDYYTHLDVTEPRAVTFSEVLQYMEDVLLAILIPSSLLHRTLMLGVFHLYDAEEPRGT